MSVKKSVFASFSEKEIFYKLQRVWSEKYKIYHNLPFLNVFRLDDLIDMAELSFDPLTLSEIEIVRLKNTTIDYTLCDEADAPILCIEFGGVQQGYNVGITHHARVQISKTNPWQQAITGLKLKVAQGSMFPFFVIGSKELEDISPGLKLAIVDGIIWAFLGNKAAEKELQFSPEKAGYSQEEYDALSNSQQVDILLEWAENAEIETGFENNPVITARTKLERELELHKYSFEHLTYPGFIPGDLEGLKSNILLGERVTYQTPELGDVSGEIWLPNFRIASFTVFGLVEHMAALIAIDKIIRLKRKKE